MNRRIILLLIISFLFFAGLIVIKFNLSLNSVSSNENADVQVSTADTNPIDESNSPYYLDEYYSVESESLFKINDDGEGVFENVKFFDFEYYSWLDFDKRSLRVFYILYQEERDYYLRRYHFSNENKILIELPTAENYWLISDTIADLPPVLAESSGLESTSLNFTIFSAYSKGIRGEITAGGTPNPEKFLVPLILENEEASLIYHDGEEVIVRTTEIHFR